MSEIKRPSIEVKTSLGIFEIVKPKAGVRNRAVAKAETDGGQIRHSILMMELLPKCINRRPEGIDADTPIEHILDDMEIEDYDKLFYAVADLIDIDTVNEEKKTK